MPEGWDDKKSDPFKPLSLLPEWSTIMSGDAKIIEAVFVFVELREQPPRGGPVLAEVVEQAVTLADGGLGPIF